MSDQASERAPARNREFPLLAYGFRLFFLAAALFAALAVPLWLAGYMGAVALPTPLPASLWHGHEMLFGYGTAVLAGFLLTATPGWSGRPPVKGAALATLAVIWLAGRLMSFAGGSVPGFAAAIDLAFLPTLAIAIAPALQARHGATSCSCRCSACSSSPISRSSSMPSTCCQEPGRRRCARRSICSCF
jgi:uncharacterized protein involved in response to NO